ncbi:Oidioi.mRNA.OKI2018_I69.XSR.g13282.t1.cds [Oikopleura dioica]|uniref:Oidioi.mRNA.OKI2018_I69.XSR.g13282.t1.cds n=1 Tax=Oikopleura dioica TaxID=34765 RepID=A0ABN7SBL4_OIKDI|nr:Oidioi.mRNA.OKI2018_I69.XSR.g13282.t1.cds [Oikopleura dioica]
MIRETVFLLLKLCVVTFAETKSCQDRYSCCIEQCSAFPILAKPVESGESSAAALSDFESRNSENRVVSSLIDDASQEPKYFNLANNCGMLRGDFKLDDELITLNRGRILGSERNEHIEGLDRRFDSIFMGALNDRDLILQFTGFETPALRKQPSYRPSQAIYSQGGSRTSKLRRPPTRQEQSRHRNRLLRGGVLSKHSRRPKDAQTKRIEKIIKKINKKESHKYSPWHVHIEITKITTKSRASRDSSIKTRTCFGVLLSSSVVITSAHCFKRYNTSTEEVDTFLTENDFISIYVGLEHTNDIGAPEESSRNERVQKAQATAQDVIFHPLWMTPSHNIAIIKLDQSQSSPFRLSSLVHPICLGAETFELETSAHALISGYEVNRKSPDKDEKLQFSLLRVTSPSECRKFGASRKKEDYFDDEQAQFDFSQIVTAESGKLYCVTAKKKELCKGSHTSSLIAPWRWSNGEARFVLAGLASRRSSTSESNCGEGPEMFIKVSRFNKFLDEFLTNWSTWSEWSECDQSCGDAKKHRVRMCESYSNERSCEGLSHESKYCRVKMCPQVSGDWSEWSKCSKQCGGGLRTRSKQCEPIDLCYEIAEQRESCNTNPCESSWAWSAWSDCQCSSTLRTRIYPQCVYKGRAVSDETCASAGPRPTERIENEPRHDRRRHSPSGLSFDAFFLTVQDEDICSAASRPIESVKDALKSMRLTTDHTGKAECQQGESKYSWTDSSRFGHCMLTLDNKLIIFGGRNAGSLWEGDLLVLNPANLRWEKHPFGGIKRAHGSCTVLSGRAWICGGEEHMEKARAGRPVSSCHSFSFKDGWRDEVSMPDPIINHAIAAFPKTNSIFIIGGRYNHRDWSTVRFLDAASSPTSRWEKAANLPERVREAIALTLDDSIYVFAKSAYKYSPLAERNSWIHLALIKPRNEFLAALSIGPRIWMISAAQSARSSGRLTIEQFNTMTNQTQSFDSFRFGERAKFGIALVPPVYEKTLFRQITSRQDSYDAWP